MRVLSFLLLILSPALIAKPFPLDKNRDFHYRFAHKLLPNLFFEKTDWLIDLFEEEGNSGIQAIWTEFEKKFEEKDHISRKGLKIEHHSIGETVDVYLVVMPKAKAHIEAMYTAMVLQEFEEYIEISYRTWELTANLENTKKVALYGGWTRQGSHLNYGYEDKLSKRSFLARLSKEYVEGDTELKALSIPEEASATTD